MVVERSGRGRRRPLLRRGGARHLETTYGATASTRTGFRSTPRSTPQIQRATEAALRDGLLRLDHRRGWRGAAPARPAARPRARRARGAGAAASPVPESWLPGLVLEAEAQPRRACARRKARSQLSTRRASPGPGRRAPARAPAPGDIAWFAARRRSEDGPRRRVWMLEQEPTIEGAALVLESATGAVRALVGGWDFARNQVQPRHAGAAPGRLGVQAVRLRRRPRGRLHRRPTRCSTRRRSSPGPTACRATARATTTGSYYGIVTLRRALEQSVNVPAVKLLDLVGVDRG